MKQLLVASAIALVTLAGCNRPQWEDDASSTAEARQTPVRFRPLGEMTMGGAQRYRGMSSEAVAARLELMDQVMDRVDLIREALNSGDEWRVVADRIAAIMSSAREASEYESWFVDQIGASLVLEALVEKDGRILSQDAMAAAGRSLEILSARESPNAPLISAALELLMGYWPTDKIRGVAARSVQNTSRYLSDCPSCDRNVSNQKSARTERRILERGLYRLNQLARL